jgi:hypothetical protein
MSRPSEFFLPFATPVLQFATQEMRKMKYMNIFFKDRTKNYKRIEQKAIIYV